MPGKSIEQRIADAEVRIRQLQARKQALAQRHAQKERRERTRRLIQIGAIMTKIGADTVARAQALQREADQRPEVRDWLAQVFSFASVPGEPGTNGET